MAGQMYHQTTIWGWWVPQLLDPRHELLVLAGQIEWEAMIRALRPYYHRLGRYAKPIRLMVGLHLLKHRLHLSDKAVVQGLHETLYGMAFCGIDVGAVLAQAKPGEPCQFLHPSTLTKWRRRLGAEGTHALERVVQQQLAREHVINGRRMVTDTTAQAKYIAYPTDTVLWDKGRRTLRTLIDQAQASGVAVTPGLRRFTRAATRVVLPAMKLGKDRLERIQAANRQLSARARPVRRRVPRVLAPLHGKLGVLRRAGQGRAAAARRRLRDQLPHPAGLVGRVIQQHAERFQGRHVPDKVLRLPEPHVVSICKGTRAKPTEYGCKVSMSIDRQGFSITHTESARKIADAETLPDAIGSWIQVFGQPPPEVAGDRGFHHSAADRARLGTAGLPHLSIPRTGKTRHPDADTAWFQRLQRLRSHLAPVLSHLKADHHMARCRYKGFAGDQMHVSWAVLAWNTKKWGCLLQQRRLVGLGAPRRAASGGAGPSPRGFRAPS